MGFLKTEFYLLEPGFTYIFKDAKTFVSYLTSVRTVSNKTVKKEDKTKYKITANTDFISEGSPIYNASFRDNCFCIIGVEPSVIDMIIAQYQKP